MNCEDFEKLLKSQEVNRAFHHHQGGLAASGEYLRQRGPEAGVPESTGIVPVADCREQKLPTPGAECWKQARGFDPGFSREQEQGGQPRG